MDIKKELFKLSYEDLVEDLGTELADAVINQKDTFDPDADVEGGYTKEEWEDIQRTRPSVPQPDDDISFTELSKDVSFMANLNAIETGSVCRWVEIEALREHYKLFEDFLYDCMTELMGFECSELQVDIGEFLESGIQYSMVQAQRSQAKSTIVAMFSVWQLIHDCKHRILIISAGADVAAEIANWVIQIIMTWDLLECMRPDRTHGDRASSKNFDVHWQLKGAEKSPSIACIGITANMQGRRADLLIPDDIESSKNGTTEVQRAALEHLSKDFTSICQKGRIMYLGTPQTVDSVYNNLPARGYEIRIWTGRFPTAEELPSYEGRLAPYLQNLMDKNPLLQTGGGLDGTRGQPTDPVILGEDLLSKKELDQGPSYFNLQHMLNTKLSDEERHPLKPKDLIVMDVPLDKAPGQIQWMPAVGSLIPTKGYNCNPQLYSPFSVSTEMYEYEGKYMYVDTAGGGKNGDETVCFVTYFLHGYVFLADMLALAGGFSDDNFLRMSEFAYKHQVNLIEVEKNFGNGQFAWNWRPILLKHYESQGKTHAPSVEDVWESGQKEKRIIDVLEPVMARHRLIMNASIIETDLETIKKYPIDVQQTYLLFHQMCKITVQKGALIHDDRLDAMAGAVRYWIERMAVDEVKRMEHKTSDDNLEFFKEWGGDIGIGTRTLGLSSDRFQRKQTRR